MKRIIFGGIIGLFFMHASGTLVQAAKPLTPPAEKPALCGMSAPESCFYVSTYGQNFKRTDPLDYCPKPGIRGLSEETPFSALYKELDIDTGDSISNMTNLQLLLSSSTSCGGRICAPQNEDIEEYPLDANDDDLSVKCLPPEDGELLSDGKYGVCTKEAVRRYLAWYKAETVNCDKSPTLNITASEEITQDSKTNAQITLTPGEAWIWSDEENFILPETATPIDASQLEELTISFPESNITQTETISNPLAIKDDIPLSFSNSGTVTLNATGVVKKKPFLAVKNETTTITIIKPEKKITDAPENELTCKQLLPKYLVGASCEKELKGDARDITYWIQKFSGQITTFIAAIAVLLIAWNAFGLVMAAGDSDQIATGKKALMWVGIGLLLTVFAYVIVKTVLSLTFLQ